MNVTKSDVNLFWSKQAFDLNLKSYEGNCDLCWKKSLRKLMTIAKENHKLTAWWLEMEEKYKLFTPKSRELKAKPPYMFYRDNMSISEILEDSNTFFEVAQDESKHIDTYKQQSIWDNFLDSNFGCIESCELY